MVLQCLFVFIAMAVTDVLWTQYIIATTKGLAFKAAIWSASIVLMSGAIVCVYVSNHWTILVAAAGAFVGAYLSVSRSKDKVVPPQ
jgi:hypothetical protein